jgi:hypothetical protein
VWYKFCTDYVKKILRNIPEIDPIIVSDPTDEESTLEENISKEREKKPSIPADIIRQFQFSRDPNRYFSNGQGGAYRMQEGRDQVWNAAPDNFINTTDWNS